MTKRPTIYADEVGKLCTALSMSYYDKLPVEFRSIIQEHGLGAAAGRAIMAISNLPQEQVQLMLQYSDPPTWSQTAYNAILHYRIHGEWPAL